MQILTIDTSAIASAALLSFDPEDPQGLVTVEANFATADTRSHAEVLAPGVQSLFADPVAQGPKLAAIVVGVGPGPFTGLRSGIAMARTLAFAWNVPLWGLMSLDALAWDVVAARKNSAENDAETDLALLVEDEFVVATDARRKEVYWARYTDGGELLSGPTVGPAAEIPPLPVYGTGAGLYAQELSVNGCVIDSAMEAQQPTARSLGLMAAHKIQRGITLSDTTPLYLRESDAKVPGPRKRAL